MSNSLTVLPLNTTQTKIVPTYAYILPSLSEMTVSAADLVGEEEHVSDATFLPGTTLLQKMNDYDTKLMPPVSKGNQ